ncbi:MAG: (2Fe-2S) ferredoxin domain-containing protein, partial [Thermodesulfovibrionales bacterium]
MEKVRANVMLCGGTGCIASGGLKIKDALDAEIKKRGLENEINVIVTGCNGFCAQGPIMTVYPEGIFYQKLTVDDIPL